jgi:hypothetical protein
MRILIAGYIALLLLTAAIVHAQVTGTASLTVAQVSSNGLLSGCVVNAANTGVTGCARSYPPAGWVQGLVQNFESGTLGPNELLAGSTTIVADPAHSHTGSHSMQETITTCSVGNCSPGGQWEVRASAIGCCPGGDYYYSMWTYLDPNAVMNTESVFSEIDTTNQAVLVDTQKNVPANLITNADLFWTAQGCAVSGCNGLQTGYTGKIWNMNLGTWEQEETHLHANTCSGSVPNDDGVVDFYINGALVMHIDKNVKDPNNPGADQGITATSCRVGANFNAPAHIWAGGYWTYFGGNPTAFNKYVDDIIILHR